MDKTQKCKDAYKEEKKDEKKEDNESTVIKSKRSMFHDMLYKKGQMKSMVVRVN
jgi:hypothetical protein